MATQIISPEAYQLSEQYGLGTPVGRYTTRSTALGWMIFWMLLLLLLLSLGGIIWLYSSMMPDLTPLPGMQEPFWASPLFAVIPLALYAGFMILLIAWRLRENAVLATPLTRRIVVDLFSDGLLYREGRKTQAVPWERIKSVRRHVHGRSYACTLKFSDETELILKPVIFDLRKLSGAIEQELTKRILPAYIADYRAGKQIVFPGLCISRRYLAASEKKLPWDAVGKVKVGPEKLIIKEKGVKKDWLAAPVSQFPNLEALEELLIYIRKERSQAGNIGV